MRNPLQASTVPRVECDRVPLTGLRVSAYHPDGGTQRLDNREVFIWIIRMRQKTIRDHMGPITRFIRVYVRGIKSAFEKTNEPVKKKNAYLSMIITLCRSVDGKNEAEISIVQEVLLHLARRPNPHNPGSRIRRDLPSPVNPNRFAPYIPLHRVLNRQLRGLDVVRVLDGLELDL